uniref:Uncharacterized protein n=1 Tax=Photinus pyralis TaxID=7054 RepID=A0A1Y1MDK6_PHOPY
MVSTCTDLPGPGGSSTMWSNFPWLTTSGFSFLVTRACCAISGEMGSSTIGSGLSTWFLTISTVCLALSTPLESTGFLVSSIVTSTILHGMVSSMASVVITFCTVTKLLLLTVPSELVTTTSYSPCSSYLIRLTAKLYVSCLCVSLVILIRASALTSRPFLSHFTLGSGHASISTSKCNVEPSSTVVSCSCRMNLGLQLTTSLALVSVSPSSLITLHLYWPERLLVTSFITNLQPSSDSIRVNSFRDSIISTSSMNHLYVGLGNASTVTSSSTFSFSFTVISFKRLVIVGALLTSTLQSVSTDP